MIMKEYQVIYADPPWDQKAGRKLAGYKTEGGKQVFSSNSNKTENLPYKTMTVDDIAALNVKGIAADDSFLFMWVTNKYLLQCESVIKSWGFKYVACITWKKKRMGGGLGGVVRITSEYLLFCRRGNLKAAGTIPESVVDVKRQYVNGHPCHSKKPDYFAEMIESVSPAGNMLEMFARNEREGWDVFGNEAPNSISI